ncbi:DUF4157 domain-containing protein [Chitinophaga horti]|uniref:DUF4157 domain-containing protein n=1 Tax=Chitinophaga horti TaxID=2920382 RepID=A0ABY6J1K4_9BACT|nr:DUF4157 domain-containing protein [Chitinophaga horti]UYQ93543.1 DUF4157 domain-containing protein [Chitinophaga horti]
MKYKKRQPDLHQSPKNEPPFFPSTVQRAAENTGAPLPDHVQQFFAPRFGQDFGHVRVHTDEQAANAFGAKAFTQGSHIVFNQGQYNPDSREGQRLLAHELTHVTQQQSGRTQGVQREPLGGSDQDKAAALWTSYQNSIEIDSFEFGTAALTPEHIERLKEYKQRITGLLLHYPDSFLTLWGHTDAVDTEAKNEALGLARAEAVKQELTSGESALPDAMISTRTVGEREPAVKSSGREPRNRRVQLLLSARRFITPPKLDWTPQPPLKGDYKLPDFHNPFWPKVPTEDVTPDYYQKIPDLRLPRKTPIEAWAEDDPLLKTLLTPGLKKELIDAIKDGDEIIAEKILDALPIEDKLKSALKATAKGLLQWAKGKRWTPPEPPLHPMPPSGAPPYQPAPGETIIPGPSLKFDENKIIDWFRKL